MIEQSVQCTDACTPCCKKRQAFVTNPWHYLSCPSSISIQSTAQHNNISLQFKHTALDGGCYARYEPKDLSQDDHKRPGVELFALPAATLMASDSIAPESKLNLPKVNLCSCWQSSQEEKQQVSSSCGIRFAFICMRNSRWHIQKRQESYLVNFCSWLSRRTDINGRFDDVAIHIRRGNAAIVRASEAPRRIASRHLWHNDLSLVI